MEVKGVPPDKVLEKSWRKKLYFNDKNEPTLKPNSSGVFRRPNSKSLKDLMDTEDDLFVDFINKCIEWDRDEWLDPESALNHEWIIEGLKEFVSLNPGQSDRT